jgi:hypothetical protein
MSGMSLQFNQLYEMSIDKSDKANMPSKRIHNIIEYMTYEIYLYIQVGGVTSAVLSDHSCLGSLQHAFKLTVHQESRHAPHFRYLCSHPAAWPV